jgi:hypothetical protein
MSLTQRLCSTRIALLLFYQRCEFPGLYIVSCITLSSTLQFHTFMFALGRVGASMSWSSARRSASTRTTSRSIIIPLHQSRALDTAHDHRLKLLMHAGTAHVHTQILTTTPTLFTCTCGQHTYRNTYLFPSYIPLAPLAYTTRRRPCLLCSRPSPA